MILNQKNYQNKFHIEMVIYDSLYYFYYQWQYLQICMHLIIHKHYNIVLCKNYKLHKHNLICYILLQHYLIYSFLFLLELLLTIQVSIFIILYRNQDCFCLFDFSCYDFSEYCCFWRALQELLNDINRPFIFRNRRIKFKRSPNLLRIILVFR